MAYETQFIFDMFNCLCILPSARKIEDKSDAKGIASFPISIRMELPPQNKAVPIHFGGWVLLDDGTVADNIFLNCQLMQDRTDSLLLRQSHHVQDIVESSFNTDYCFTGALESPSLGSRSETMWFHLL